MEQRFELDTLGTHENFYRDIAKNILGKRLSSVFLFVALSYISEIHIEKSIYPSNPSRIISLSFCF